jgi:hypothetical protein
MLNHGMPTMAILLMLSSLYTRQSDDLQQEGNTTNEKLSQEQSIIISLQASC